MTNNLGLKNTNLFNFLRTATFCKIKSLGLPISRKDKRTRTELGSRNFLAVIQYRLFFKAKKKYEQPKSLAFWLCPLCPQMRSITCCSVTHLFLLFSLGSIHILRLNIFVLFLTPLAQYVSMNTLLQQQKLTFPEPTCPRSFFFLTYYIDGPCFENAQQLRLR